MKKLFTGIALLFSATGFTQNVGIGTTAPTKPLTIQADGIGVSQESSTGGAKIGFYTSTTNAYLQTHNTADLKFATNDSTFTMILKRGSGNLGVGASTPIQKLEIAGGIKIGTTATNSAGSIRYTQADSSFQAYDNTQWKSMINNFDVVGADNNGFPISFNSMIRSAFVNLPALTYTIKKSGYYLILVSAEGTGSQEKNNINNPNDNRTDFEGQIRLSPGGSPSESYLRKKFFYSHADANGDGTQDVTLPYHSDDGEKSVIKYFEAGAVIQANAFIQQAVGPTAPAQQNPWYIYAQVKYILLY